jgi:hypothetical protein
MRRRDFIVRFGGVAAGPALWPLAAALAPGLSLLRTCTGLKSEKPDF